MEEPSEYPLGELTIPLCADRAQKIEALGMEPWEQGALSQILELQSAEWPRLTHWLAARLPTPSVEKQPM